MPALPNPLASSTSPRTELDDSARYHAANPEPITPIRAARSLPRSVIDGRCGTTRLCEIIDPATSRQLFTVDRMAETSAPTNNT